MPASTFAGRKTTTAMSCRQFSPPQRTSATTIGPSARRQWSAKPLCATAVGSFDCPHALAAASVSNMATAVRMPNYRMPGCRRRGAIHVVEGMGRPDVGLIDLALIAPEIVVLDVTRREPRRARARAPARTPLTERAALIRRPDRPRSRARDPALRIPPAPRTARLSLRRRRHRARGRPGRRAVLSRPAPRSS